MHDVYQPWLALGSFESRDDSGALASPDSVDVKVYLDGALHAGMSAQASNYRERSTGLNTYQFDTSQVPAGTTILVDARATVGTQETVTTDRFVKPGLMPYDLHTLERMRSGYYGSNCSPCNQYMMSPY